MQKCAIQEEQRRMTDDVVADLVNHAVDDYLEDAGGEEEKAHRMSHNGGPKATETIEVYTNNRGCVPLLRRWHDIAASEKYRLLSVPKLHFYLEIYITLNTSFVGSHF